MNSRKKTYYVFLVLSLLLFLSDLSSIIYNLLIEKGSFTGVNLVIVVINTTVLVLFVAFALAYVYKGSKERKILARQNFYNFRRAIYFDNFESFLNKVSPRYLKKKDESYIISFAPFSDRTILELIQSPTIIEFYGLFVDFIRAYFRNDKNIRRLDYEVCYDNRSFVFYIRKPYSYIEKMIKDFEDEAYLIKSKYDFRIFIQPFFGIFKIENDDVSLFDAVNNALIARRYGQSNYELSSLFDKKMVKNDEIEGDISIESILEGLKNNEFEVYYQPKFHLKSKTFIGAEALIRWRSPKLGFVSPNKFITLAENGGIIHDIDAYLLDKVCADIEEWKKRGREILPISVNVSLYEFYEPTFVNDIQTIIERHKVNPIYIEVEITEKTNSAYSFLIVSVLKKIKDMKIKILMDDFGTGFSNIVNLKKLPIDIVKLDKSLVDDIAFDIKAKEIVRAVILSCHAMNIQIIAEGADSKEQIKILTELNCDTIQGFYYSQPRPKIEYERFLSNNDFETKRRK